MSQNKECFDSSTSFTDTHDELQAKVGKAMWLNEFSPSIKGSERRIAEVLLRLVHTLALCCAIAGEFAMHIGGKLVSRPDLITIYIACHPQKWSLDISVLLQMQRTPAFSLGCLDLLFIPECSIPGKIIHYVIIYGVEVRGLRIVCVESVKCVTHVLI